MLIIYASDCVSSTNIPFSLKSVDTIYLYFKGPILSGKITFRWSVLKDLFKFDLSFFSLRNV